MKHNEESKQEKNERNKENTKERTNKMFNTILIIKTDIEIIEVEEPPVEDLV